MLLVIGSDQLQNLISSLISKIAIDPEHVFD